MKIKVGINGMGRIGRMIVRAIFESKNKNIEIKHINNRTNTETCSNLLKYDSIHGRFNAKVNFDKNCQPHPTWCCTECAVPCPGLWRRCSGKLV